MALSAGSRRLRTGSSGFNSGVDRGGWLDTDNGSYYFDSVRIFPEDSLEYAIQFGRENGQIAVFVLSKQLIIKQPFE